MSRNCLDTVTYSHFKRGDARVTALVESADWIGMPTIVPGELLADFARGSKVRQNTEQLSEFLASPIVNILPVDRYVAGIFGDLVSELRSVGKPIPSNDVRIAATCAHSGATLLTFDSHFRSLPRTGSLIPD